MSSVQTPMPPTSATYALKSALRKQMLAKLRSVPEAELKSQSKQVFEHLKSTKAFQEAETVCCYLSMQKGELQTDEIVAHLLERGTTLYTPYLPPQDPTASSSKLPPHPDQDMRMLRLYSPRDLKGCPTDKWGILDPGVTRLDTTGHAVREDVMDQGSPKLDLILLPGVAFDSDYNRMGRGKGYYDRFLHRYAANHPKPTLCAYDNLDPAHLQVALALTPQVLPAGEVPHDSEDEPLDGIVSPAGVQTRDGVNA